MTDDWTNWVDIDSISEHQGPAVYKVRLIDSNGNRCQLPRLLKTDREGIMCIGQTSNMKQRRGQFLSAIKGAYGHSSMNLVYYLNTYTDFPNKFKDSKFQYSFRKCKSIEEGKESEHKLMKSYFKKYGEVPPLNSILPKRNLDWET